MDHSINHSIGSWTKVSIAGIKVTNGTIQVGVSSTADANNRVNVDDFSLVQAGQATDRPITTPAPDMRPGPT